MLRKFRSSKSGSQEIHSFMDGSRLFQNPGFPLILMGMRMRIRLPASVFADREKSWKSVGFLGVKGHAPFIGKTERICGFKGVFSIF